ncbi:cupin domain-containing protein [Janthinobacterium lividum]|uniref:cupin domain-containing protein n=1 Tax=Janthinobacterium lividum TaxID=29581 RepID=UPI00140BF2EF|nr:cupin domain-containing protein [Janthinobacterium lividum]NHQ93232.1 cupin domain-containing protein [Janthinobacterium lividum]
MSTTTTTTTIAATTTRGQGQSIDLAGKIALIEGHWQPRVIAEMNDYQFKVVKVFGEFEWHRHADTDETFIVLEGELRIALRGPGYAQGHAIVLTTGQMAVVPEGVEHKPCALAETRLLLIEPRGVVNTGDGDAGGRTVENDQWI